MLARFFVSLAGASLAGLALVSLADGGVHACVAQDTSPLPALSLAVGSSEVFHTQPGLATIVLGDPAIADVSLINGSTIAVTGKRQGATNLILLDAAGSEISRSALHVVPRQIQVIVMGGEKAQNYLCMPHCVAAPKSTLLAGAGPMTAEPAPPQAADGAAPPADAPPGAGRPE